MTSLEQIIDDFSFLDDWEDRYRYVIELGKALPDLPDDKKTSANKVMGCASQVWLVTHTAGDPDNPVMTFEGDSDAHIVRGLVAIVLATYSGKTASEIAALDAFDVFSKIGKFRRTDLASKFFDQHFPRTTKMLRMSVDHYADRRSTT